MTDIRIRMRNPFCTGALVNLVEIKSMYTVQKVCDKINEWKQK